MDPDDERFTAKTTVLIEIVTRHIKDEEQNWFPEVPKGLGRKQLQDIGATMANLRKKAALGSRPTHGRPTGPRPAGTLGTSPSSGW